MQMALLGSPRSMLSECRILLNTHEFYWLCGIEVSRRVLYYTLSPCALKGSSIGRAFSIETRMQRLKIIFSYTRISIIRDIVGPCWNSERKLIKSRPQIRQGYLLNLGILIRGGTETNKDSLSNGKWSGNSSDLKSPTLVLQEGLSKRICRA